VARLNRGRRSRCRSRPRTPEHEAEKKEEDERKPLRSCFVVCVCEYTGKEKHLWSKLRKQTPGQCSRHAS
jgi:hypothetical protein